MPESDTETVNDDPQDSTINPSDSIRLDSGRFLIRRPEYPDALPPISCISFATMDPEDVPRIRKAVQAAAYAQPGDFVQGARELPRYRQQGVIFYTVAGFDPETVASLTEGMWENPLED